MKKLNLNDHDYIFKRVAILNAGESFGELALIDSRKGKRAARIVSTK